MINQTFCIKYVLAENTKTLGVQLLNLWPSKIWHLGTLRMTLHLYGKREKEIGEGKKGGLG
jgi:hypothetical protein